MGDIDFDSGVIIFPKKNRRHLHDQFPIYSELEQLLHEIKSASNHLNENNQKIFKWQDSSRSYLSKKLKNVLEKHNLKKEGVLFHSVRKYFITNLAKKKISPLELRRIARHSDIKITDEHYIDYGLDELRSVFELCTTIAPKNLND